MSIFEHQSLLISSIYFNTDVGIFGRGGKAFKRSRLCCSDNSGMKQPYTAVKVVPLNVLKCQVNLIAY